MQRHSSLREQETFAADQAEALRNLTKEVCVSLPYTPNVGAPALATDHSNHCVQISSARVILQRIESVILTGMSLMTDKFPTKVRRPPAQVPTILIVQAPPSEHPKVAVRDIKAGEIRPHITMHVCLDGVDEKIGAIPYSCHGRVSVVRAGIAAYVKGGNQFWKWTKHKQLSVTGLCLDGTGVKVNTIEKTLP